MNRRHLLCFTFLLFGMSLMATSSLAAENDASGQLLELRVPGPSLANNTLGYSTERDVRVYLPPGYTSDSERRYPVVYVLHGITDPLTVWTVPWSEKETDFGTIQNLMDRGINSGALQKMIVVLFDARTPFFGCHYVNSAVKGNWQDFLVKDLVTYVDSSFRTLARKNSRGVMGHSMGGYGALRAGLDRPDVFSVTYGLSPSLLGWHGDLSTDNPAFEIVAVEEDPTAFIEANFYVGAVIGVSQAFSPNPGKPPLFADYPFKMNGTELVPNEPAHSRWEENFLANRIDAYLEQPIRLSGIMFDVGLADQFSHIPPTTRQLSETLTEKGVDHSFEMYNGDHRNRLWGKHGRLYSEALPFLSRHLLGEKQQ